MGMTDPARRPVGQLRTRLEYADTRELPGQLPELLGALQEACVEACEAITKRYFEYEALVAWERDGLSMGWRLRVVHTTKVSYSAPVRASFNEVRMTPLTLPTQTTLESRVSAGAGVPVWTYCDYWGTYVSAFGITEPHEALMIEARATVETDQSFGFAMPAPLSWEELREQARSGPLLEFLLTTPLTTLTPAAAATVVDAVRGADPVEAAEEISSRVRSQVAYMAGTTGVRTNAQEAWDQGQGVCQDMAHVTVALMRAAGLPARYVSGYLHADPSAEPGHTTVGESHAWVEYWAGSWRALDPTNDAYVGERHVVVARGRDYDDIPPLKGIYHGPPASAQQVTVEVTRLA
jgi:transglutaminase-like putative cysteine protease